jgi:hypothetical protein
MPRFTIRDVLWLTVVVVALAIWSSNLQAGENGWQHFVLGGELPTGSPSPSPDGSMLLYANPTTGHCDIYALDLKNGTNRRLTTDERFEANPRYLPTGDGFVFEREQDGRRHIIFRSLTDDSEVSITRGDVLDDIADVSKDGRWLLVERSTYRRFASGRQVQTYLVDRARPDQAPTEIGISALFVGEASIAFNLNLIKDGVAPDLFIRSIGSDERKRLGSGFIAARDPTGSRLAVRQSEWPPRSLDSQLATINVETGTESKFAVGFGPCFLGDGVTYFRGYPATKDRKFFVFRNGAETQIANCPYGIVSDFAWATATEDHAFFWVREFVPREFSIYQLDAKTVRFTKLLSVPDPRAGPGDK